MINDLETLSLDAWPAFETVEYDGWILRFAEGYTKRANSVNPLYPSTIALDKKIAYCERAYAQRGLPPVFKLTAETSPSILDRVLEERGYRKLDETSVQVLPLRTGWPLHGIGIWSHASEEWIRAFARCSAIDDADTMEKMGRVLRSIRGETIFAYIEEEERIIACGLGVLERGYLGCFNIVVDSARRKRGYGRRIMEGLLAEGIERGAQTAYLQVVAGNHPAERLYDSLGFRESYRYWYRKKG